MAMVYPETPSRTSAESPLDSHEDFASCARSEQPRNASIHCCENDALFRSEVRSEYPPRPSPSMHSLDGPEANKNELNVKQVYELQQEPRVLAVEYYPSPTAPRKSRCSESAPSRSCSMVEQVANENRLIMTVEVEHEAEQEPTLVQAWPSPQRSQTSSGSGLAFTSEITGDAGIAFTGHQAESIRDRQSKFLVNVGIVLNESANFLKRNFQSKIFDGSYEELRNFHSTAKLVVDEIQNGMYMLQDREIQFLQAEKERSASQGVMERVELLNEIHNLEQAKLKSSVEFTKLLSLVDNLYPLLREGNAGKTHLEHESGKRMKMFQESDIEKGTCQVDAEREVVEATETRNREYPGRDHLELAIQDDKVSCQICFEVPPDSLILPCMHFTFCKACLDKHQENSSECPYCKTSMTGVVRCNLELSAVFRTVNKT